MTNPPAPEWPDEIYLLQVTDPVQGGPDGVANVATKQLDTRTQMLRTGQVAQAGQITQIQTALTELTQVVAGSQAEVLAGIVGAQFSATGTYAEAFAAGWTLIDLGAGTAPLPLTNAVVPVAGDDSLDVTNTTALIVGETYILFDNHGYRQEVTVSQILDGTRIRVTPTLTGAVQFPAHLSRTDWDVSTPRQATAAAGGIYRTRPLDLGPSAPEGHAIIIRHSGAGTFDVEWSDATSDGMTDAPWWRRRTASGATETQYLVPSNGPTRLRITAVGGPSVIHWITTQPKPALAEGGYNPHPRPRLVSPMQGSQVLGPHPVLQIAPYSPPPGLTVAGVVYEVARTADNAVVHTSTPQPVGSAYTLPDGVVQQGTDYRFTARIKAGDGSLGDPAKPVIARTIPDFRVILPPTITSPANGATVQTGTALSLSAFAVLRGTDTQTGVQMQVRRSGQEWSEAWDSGTLPVGALLPLAAPAALMGWAVQVRVRHWGAALGPGAWSATLSVTISNEIWITDVTLTELTLPESGTYLPIPVTGGSSGSASIAVGFGGGAGRYPFVLEERTYTAGQVVPIRVGRGGAAYTTSSGSALGGNISGQTSFFDDIISPVGSGTVPYGTAPPDNLSPVSSGSSNGGGGAYDPPAGTDGVPGDGPLYWTKLGLRPGLGGVGVDTRPVPLPGEGGAGGVLPPWPIPKLAGTGVATLRNNHPPSNTVAGQTYEGGTGGEGYGAGGGTVPYGHDGVISMTSGKGAQGVIILKKLID